MEIKELRREYPEKELKRKDLLENPFDLFILWFEEALGVKTIEVNAMSLATASKEGRPSNRTVLLKYFDENGLVFFTSYESRKAKELEENPHAAATFFWHEQMRQICVEGTVQRSSIEESREYFATRPRGSQIGAWASHQDMILTSKKVLLDRFSEMDEKYRGKEVPLPPYWGGYRLIPERFEFWQGHANRLHDRFEYILIKDEWTIRRLSP